MRPIQPSSRICSKANQTRLPVEPDLLRCEVLPLTVSLDADEARGHTRERANGTPTTVAHGVDVDCMMALLGRVLPIRP